MTNETENGTGESGDGDAQGTPAPEPVRCPICLTPPEARDPAVPESCSHVFCLRCILKWAQTVPSCPVDRKRFNVVYKLDTILGAVKIPVKQLASLVGLQICCHNKRKETKGCISRRRAVEKTLEGNSHAKVKEDFVRKCKSRASKCNQESLDLRKKMGMDVCGPQILAPYTFCLDSAGETSATLTRCYAELLRVDIREPFVLQKQHRLELEEQPWLCPAAPMPASGLSLHPGSLSESLRSLSPQCTSAAGLHAGCFVFEVEDCIVTCARGGEKKTVRPSISKGSKNQTEDSAAKRSSWHSKAEDQPSPPSHHSSSDDSVTDSPTRQTPQPDLKVARGMNAKQVTKQQSPAKRRRQKASQEPYSSLEKFGAEELVEEEEGEEEKEETDEDSEFHISGHQNANSQSGTSKQHTNQEASHIAPPEHDTQQEVSCNIITDHNLPQATSSDISQQECEGVEDWAKSESDTSRGCDSEEMAVTQNKVPTFSPGQGHLKMPSSDEELRECPKVSPNREHAAAVELEKGAFSVEEDDMLSSGHQKLVEPERPSENIMSSSCDQLIVIDVDLMEATAEGAESQAQAEMEKPSQDSKPNTSAFSNGDRTESSGSVSDKFQNADSNVTILKWTPEMNHEEFPSEDNTDLVSMECDSPSSEFQELGPEQEGGSTRAACMTPQTAPVDPAVVTVPLQDKTEARPRKSRFHSPSTTWSPKRDSKREQHRSPSQDRNATPTSRHRSRTCSRERDNDRSRDRLRREGSRRNRSRDRRSRRRSRSRSRSRNRMFCRGSPPERAEPGRQSPHRRDRRANDAWRNNWGNDQSKSDDQDRLSGAFSKDVDDSDKRGPAAERSRGQNIDGMKEKCDLEGVGCSTGIASTSRWEESHGGWNSESRRDIGWGRGGPRDEPQQNRWQTRNSLSGIANSSGNESHSKFNEGQSASSASALLLSEVPVDRSGWSSASSRAVRRTLPADVQSYYSRRGRNSAGPGCGWNRQDEEMPAQDVPRGEPQATPRSEGSQLVPSIPQQPMAVLHFPMGAHAPPMSLQPPHFGVPPQVPAPVHPAMPLFQGLPPPPPPPPPLQQVDGRPARQAMTSIPGQGGNRFTAPSLASYTKVPGSAGHPSAPLPSSTTQHGAADRLSVSKDFTKVEACADSSKKEKKLQIQEKAIQEVKTAIKPFYQNKEITKDEYKEIVRKAVEKVCHSKSGEVNSGKVANLVKAYVEKYKHVRKNKSDVLSKC
ncbi:protein SCAF11 isoform X1 [Megalops cyprinoides]|uniref:protein SCAF11 isoform X1 n=1 Tax=Megalops cyprinoides TaxID=118141 RepID=UPI001864B1C9|nr:protein SCAF11 isoform X1 [Megalops cyprinoides]XP_036373621.1 protein SCAF11 isoform X1 [Megalops cyprinoides]